MRRNCPFYNAQMTNTWWAMEVQADKTPCLLKWKHMRYITFKWSSTHLDSRVLRPAWKFTLTKVCIIRLRTCAQTLLWYHVLNKVLIPRMDFTCKLLASFREVVKFVQHWLWFFFLSWKLKTCCSFTNMLSYSHCNHLCNLYPYII